MATFVRTQRDDGSWQTWINLDRVTLIDGIKPRECCVHFALNDQLILHGDAADVLLKQIGEKVRNLGSGEVKFIE